MDVALSQTLEELFQPTSVDTLIVNCSGKIVFMNNKVIDTLKYLNIQASFFEFTEKNNKEWGMFVHRVTQENAFSYTCILKDEKHRFISMKLIGHYIREKQLILCQLQFKTQQKKNTNDQQLYQFINDLPHGIVLTSMNGKIISSNLISIHLLGFEVGQIENRNYELLFENCFYDKQAILQYYRKIANNELASILVKSIGLDRREHYLTIDSKVDEVLGLLVTTITDQTEKIELMETVNHQKSLSIVGQNVASIVHEIRNPMTSIQGFIQMIKENLEEQVNPYFQIVETELQRINEMLMDLLTISKPKKYDMCLLDLKSVIEQAIALLQFKALEVKANIVFEFDEGTSYLIKGNYNRLKQMVINLLKNAIEAVQTESSIFARLTYVNSTTLRLVIEDQGKGMSTEQLGVAFDSFYSTKSTGTGLGLLLVQDIIEEHNGKLTVVSTEGIGSIFSIDFDLITSDLNEITIYKTLNAENNQQTYPQTI